MLSLENWTGRSNAEGIGCSYTPLLGEDAIDPRTEERISG
jgi:hypothetical protein